MFVGGRKQPMSDYQGRRRNEAALRERLRGLTTLPAVAAGLVVIVILVIAAKILYAPARSTSVLPELPLVPTGLVDPPSESSSTIATPTAQPSGGRLPQITRYEAEDAQISRGFVDTKHAGYSGSGFVDYTNIAGSYVQWTVQASRQGTVTVRLRYANGSVASRPTAIVVNGVVVIPGIAFDRTGAWTSWKVQAFTLNLNAGSNTIRAVATSAGGGPNADYLEIEQ
jgi:Carbohydrate binding module (family 35)